MASQTLQERSVVQVWLVRFNLNHQTTKLSSLWYFMSLITKTRHRFPKKPKQTNKKIVCRGTVESWNMPIHLSLVFCVFTCFLWGFVKGGVHVVVASIQAVNWRASVGLWPSLGVVPYSHRGESHLWNSRTCTDTQPRRNADLQTLQRCTGCTRLWRLHRRSVPKLLWEKCKWKGTADGSFTTLGPKCPNYLVMDASASGWREFRTPPCGGEIIRTQKNISLLYTLFLIEWLRFLETRKIG